MEASGLAERWHPWSPDNLVDFAQVTRKGAGRGEAKLAAEPCISGTVQGGTVSYDVVGADGKKWEVKELDKSSSIRLGVESTQEVIRFWMEAVRACQDVQRFVSSSGSLGVRFDPETNTRIETFKDEIAPKIFRGEMAKGTILGGTWQTPVGLKQVADELSSRIEPFSGRRVTAHTFLSEFSIPTDLVVGYYLDHGLKLDPDDFDPLELARGVLRHSYFQDPEILIRQWREVSKASVVFGKVDGVIMVKPDGFFIVPRDKLDSYFRFERISQRVARFKFTPPTGAPVSGILEPDTGRSEGVLPPQQV